MIFGLGIDVVEIDRIKRSLERFGERFPQKILTPQEQRAMARPGMSPASLAARFAAKEAAVKALGTGFAHGITLQDVEVRTLPSGQPEIHFHGAALEYCRLRNIVRAHLSLTHGRDTAAAVVVLEVLP